MCAEESEHSSPRAKINVHDRPCTERAGFIGSALVRSVVMDGERVVTVDKLTYARNLSNLAPTADTRCHILIQAEIGEPAAMLSNHVY